MTTGTRTGDKTAHAWEAGCEEFVLDLGDGSAPARTYGKIDRRPSGGIEVIDYETGRMSSQKDVKENLQFSIYALVSRDMLDLGSTEAVTLYSTQTGMRMTRTRPDEQLEAARACTRERALRIRSGDFAATLSQDTCWRCDYAAICPTRID